MTSASVEGALARMFDPRRNICIPNCYTSLYWEADLLVVRPSGWAEEIEVKVSAADFRREFTTKAEKHLRLVNGVAARYWTLPGWKESRVYDPANELHVPADRLNGAVTAFHDYGDISPHLIRKFWYAMPEDLCEKLRDEIPSYAGLISVTVDRWNRHRATVVKSAPQLKKARKVTEDERALFIRAGYFRFWDLKFKESRNQGKQS